MVNTDTKYVYYDNARLIGQNQMEYILPKPLANGRVSSVHIQARGNAEFWADDISPQAWQEIYGWEIKEDGNNEYLSLGFFPPEQRLIRVMGYAPLSTVSAYTDTIEIDGEYINRFIAYAKYKLYQAIEGPVSSEDIGRYETQSAKAYAEFMRLSHLKIVEPKVGMRIRRHLGTGL